VAIPVRRLIVATLVALSCGAPVLAAGQVPPKIDNALAGTLKSGASKNKVIVTVRTGYRATVRDALVKHGDRIKSEHASLDLLVTELDTATVLELAKNRMIKALSLDGPVRAHQLADGESLLGTDASALLDGSLASKVASSLTSPPVLTTTVRRPHQRLL